MKLDHITWKICTLRGKKQKEQMPHGLSKKQPAKKEKIIIIFFVYCCCCRTCSWRACTWGKLDLKKDEDRKKPEKSQKELLNTTQMAHLYGGSKISRTSNNSNSSYSNSSNNISNFGGSGLAGPPVTLFIITPHPPIALKIRDQLEPLCI